MYLSSVNRGMAAADDDPGVFRNGLEFTTGYTSEIPLTEELVSASDMKKDAIETKGTKLYADEAKKLNVALTHLLTVRSDHLTATNYASVVEDYYSKVTGSEDVESTSLSVFKTEKPRAGTKDLDDIYLNNTSGGVRVFCDTGLHPGFSINFKDSVVDVQTAGNVIDKGTGGHGCGETYPAENTTVEFSQDDLAVFGFRNISVNIRREGDIYIITITRGGAEEWVLEERVDINFVRKSGGTNYFAGNDKKNTFLKGVINSIAANIVNVEKWLTAKELGDLLQAMLAIKYARENNTITCFGFSNDRGYIGRLLRWSPENLGAVYNNPGKKDGCVKSHFMRRKQNERLFKILLRQIKLCAQQIVEHNSNIIYIINMALSIKDLPIKTTGKITRTPLVDRLLECIKGCIESANSTVRTILDATKIAFEAADPNSAITAVNDLTATLAAAAAAAAGGAAAAFPALKDRFVGLFRHTIERAAAAALAADAALAAAPGGGGGGAAAAAPGGGGAAAAAADAADAALPAAAVAAGAGAAPAAPALSATAEAKERAKDVCDILTQHKVVNIFTVAVNDRGKTVGIVINKNITRLFVEPKADTLRPDDKLYRITQAGASFMNWDLHSLFGSSHNHALILRNMDCAYVPTSRRSLILQRGGGPCKNILKQKGGGEENRSRKEYNIDKQVYNALKQVISSTTKYLSISIYDADNDPEAPNGFNIDDDTTPGYSDERFYRGKSLPHPDCINSILLDPYSARHKYIISGDARAAAVAAEAPEARAAEAAAAAAEARAAAAAERARIRAVRAAGAALSPPAPAAAARATPVAVRAELMAEDNEVEQPSDRYTLFFDNDVVCNCCRIPDNTTYNSYLRNRYSDDYIFNLNSFDVIKAEKIDDVNISPDEMTVRSIMSKMELYFNNPRTNCAFTSPKFYIDFFDELVRTQNRGRVVDILDINVFAMNTHITRSITLIDTYLDGLVTTITGTPGLLPSPFEIQQFAHGNTLARGSNPANPIEYYKSYLLKKYGFLELCSKYKEIEAAVAISGTRRAGDGGGGDDRGGDGPPPLNSSGGNDDGRGGGGRGDGGDRGDGGGNDDGRGGGGRGPPPSDGFGDELANAVYYNKYQRFVIKEAIRYIREKRYNFPLKDGYEEIYRIVQQFIGKRNPNYLLRNHIDNLQEKWNESLSKSLSGRVRPRDSAAATALGGSGGGGGAGSPPLLPTTSASSTGSGAGGGAGSPPLLPTTSASSTGSGAGGGAGSPPPTGDGAAAPSAHPSNALSGLGGFERWSRRNGTLRNDPTPNLSGRLGVGGSTRIGKGGARKSRKNKSRKNKTRKANNRKYNRRTRRNKH